MSKVLTFVDIKKITLFLIASIVLLSCGKKDNIIVSDLEKQEVSPKQDISTNPLNRENLICPNNNCPSFIAQIFNFSSVKKQQYCVGAYLGDGLVLTTATCIDQVENLKVACENIHVKLAHSDQTYRCLEIKEAGLPSNSFRYMRRKDYAIIKIQDINIKDKLEISKTAPTTGHYLAWTILNGSEFVSAIVEKNCLINEPDETEYSIEQLLDSQTEISYQIDCNSYYKFSESSLVFNKQGELIGLYSRGQNKFKASLISMACLKSKFIPGLTGENCPIFERQQTSAQIEEVVKSYNDKKYSVTLQNKITHLFKWKSEIYKNSQLYTPVCYYNYFQTKKTLMPTFASPTYYQFSYKNYLLTHELIQEQNVLKIVEKNFNADIDMKEFKKDKVLKFNFQEKFESDNLASYLQGEQVIRGSIYLKSCN